MRARRAALIRQLDDALEANPRAPFAEQLDEFMKAAQAHFTEHAGFLRVLMEAEYINVGKRVLQPRELMRQIRDRLGVGLKRAIARR